MILLSLGVAEDQEDDWVMEKHCAEALVSVI